MPDCASRIASTYDDKLFASSHFVVVTFYSNRWSCNSRLMNVHDTTSFALGLMKDSARESLSCQGFASQRDFVRELASVLKDANLSAFEH